MSGHFPRRATITPLIYKSNYCRLRAPYRKRSISWSVMYVINYIVYTTVHNINWTAPTRRHIYIYSICIIYTYAIFYASQSAMLRCIHLCYNIYIGTYLYIYIWAKYTARSLAACIVRNTLIRFIFFGEMVILIYTRVAIKHVRWLARSRPAGDRVRSIGFPIGTSR